jgi:hypothetical protein
MYVSVLSNILLLQVQTDFEEIETQVNTLAQPYPPSLYAFFAKVTENMCKSLQENLDPFAVEVFKDCGDEDSVPQKKAVKEFTFKSFSVPVKKVRFLEHLIW